MSIEEIMNRTSFTLSEEEGTQLIYYFLSECAINAMQAISDILGKEEITHIMRLFGLLASRAYVLNRFQENRFPRLLDNKNSLLTIGVFHQHLFRAVYGGKCENMMIFDRCLTCTVSDLQPLDMPLDFQNTLFSDGFQVVDVIDPQYEFLSLLRQVKGFNKHLILIKRKDDQETSIDNQGTPKLCIPPINIDPIEIDFWKRHYWGEFWRQSSSWLVEEFGEERASQIMEPYMKQTGHFYGNYFNNKFKFKDRSPQELGEVVLLLNNLLKQEGKIVKNEDNFFSCEINSCPFSNSSPFICKQISMICNSICQTINKDIGFEYDNGLMKGDKVCRWIIKKK